MVQSGMYRAWINEIGKGHLADISQSLIVGMRDQLKYKRLIDRYESVHRVINDLAGWLHC